MSEDDEEEKNVSVFSFQILKINIRKEIYRTNIKNNKFKGLI